MRWERAIAMLLPLHPQLTAAEGQCGVFAEARDLSELRDLLTDRHIFLEIDKVLIMPDVPFIDGLPGSDAFLNTLRNNGNRCEMRHFPKLAARMDAAWRDARQILVHDETPALIQDLRRGGKTVLALTNQDRVVDGRMKPDFRAMHIKHSQKLVDALHGFGVEFSPVPEGARRQDYGNATRAGGIIYGGAGARGRELAGIIRDVVPAGERAAFVHSDRRRINGALESGVGCLLGVHFVGARLREHSDASRVEWLCGELRKLGQDCPLCRDEPAGEL